MNLYDALIYKKLYGGGEMPSNAYLLQTKEHESIATFADGTDNFVKSLEVAIEPVQSGSGDPSPTNIRPISGWSAVDVTKCGKNHFDNTTSTVKKFLTSDGRIETSANWSISDYIGVKGGTAYILSGVTNAGTAAHHCFYDKDKNFISSVISTTQNFTTPSNAVYVRLSMRTETPDAVQLELGNTATEYHVYNGQTYTIDLDGTRYGGKLDVVNGVLTLTDGFISNYNGETLPSTWISDRDVYAEGTTPTIGAEVCYKLATPQTIQLTPTIIKSLQGENNFFASTGEIELLQYWGEVTS